MPAHWGVRVPPGQRTAHALLPEVGCPDRAFVFPFALSQSHSPPATWSNRGAGEILIEGGGGDRGRQAGNASVAELNPGLPEVRESSLATRRSTSGTALPGASAPVLRTGDSGSRTH